MMLFYIELIKTAEDDISADYDYQYTVQGEAYLNKAGKTRHHRKYVVGKVKIFKASGEFEIIELAEGDQGKHIARAVSALRRHWRKGEFPDKTYWIS